MKLYKRTAAVAALALSCLASLGHAADDNIRVRFIHALAGGPAVHFNVGQEHLFSNVNYGDVTPFKVLTQKEVKITLTGPNNEKIVTENEIDLDDSDDDYTVLAAPDKGDKSKIRITVLKTSNDRPKDGKAHLVLINASPDVKAAEMFYGDDKKHAGVNPLDKNGPDAVDVRPGTRIEIKNADNNASITTRNDALVSGHTYTGVVLGPSNAVIVDDDMGMISGAGARGAAAATPASAVAPAAPVTEVKTSTN